LKHKLVVIGQAIKTPEVLESARQEFDLCYFLSFSDFLSEDISAPYSLWVHFDTVLTKQAFGGRSLPLFLLTTTTGLTHLEPALRDHLGINLLSLATEVEFLRAITSTAEHTWSLLTAILNPWILNMASRQDRSSLIRETQISSMTLGVIGYGRLGRLVSEYALAFGMHVFVYEEDESVEIPVKSNLVVVGNITQLLRECDIVTLHASSKFPHKEILSREVLSHCRKGISIVNTSRGSLVDEERISELLNAEVIRWYAADMLKEEEVGAGKSPISLKDRAENRDGVILTPHIGGANLEAMQLCEENLLKRLIVAHQS
jgi:D-3-phosphoglycerate dehydrogenase